MSKPTLPSDVELDAVSDFAEDLADLARTVAGPAFANVGAVDNKAGAGAFDPVTEADRATERALRAAIEARFPDHGIKGEEYGEKPARSGWTWTLDPIDGTRAFLCGVPLWTVLIAALYEGAPLIGVIDQPTVRERYLGRPGVTLRRFGAEQKILHVRPCPRLTDAVLSTTDPFLFSPAEFAAFQLVRSAVKLARYGCDAYAYAQLARGRIDMVIESGLQDHDVAALVPVIENAGGRLLDWTGKPRPASGQVLAVGDPALTGEALLALARAAGDRAVA